MPQTHSVACPACGASLKITKASLVGKKVPCPSCKKPFVIQVPTAAYIPLADDIPLKGSSDEPTKGGASTSSVIKVSADAHDLPLLDDDEPRKPSRGESSVLDLPLKSSSRRSDSKADATIRDRRKEGSGESVKSRGNAKSGAFASQAESSEFDAMLSDSSGTDLLDEDDEKPAPRRKGKSGKRSGSDIETSEFDSMLADTDEQIADKPILRRKKARSNPDLDETEPTAVAVPDYDDDDLPPMPARTRSSGGWNVAEHGPLVVWTSVGAGVLILLLLYIFFSSRPSSVPSGPTNAVATETTETKDTEVAETEKPAVDESKAKEETAAPAGGSSLLRHKDKANGAKTLKPSGKTTEPAAGPSDSPKSEDEGTQKPAGSLKADSSSSEEANNSGHANKKAASADAKSGFDVKTAVAMAGAVHGQSGNAAKIGRTISPFSSAAVDNTTFHSADHKEQVLVVAFLGVECPLANLYAPSLRALARHYQGKSVAVIAVNSNAQDTLEQTRTQAHANGLSFPVLKDAGNVVADAFGAERTPEIFVLDAARTVRYRGMLDDQYGYRERRAQPTKTFVIDAVDALLKSEQVAVAETPVQGCHIGRVTKPSETAKSSYYRDVLPILQNRCQQCHRHGEIGPFALSDYEVVRDWGPTIRDAVAERRMPPWPADHKIGKFQNDCSLTDQEISAITQWVDDGCPQGDSAEKPAAKKFVDGWNIGKPDRIFSMPESFHVPATGVIEYKNFYVSPIFTKDTWVQGVECRFGNRTVVHHMLVLLDFPKDHSRNQDGLANGFFAAGAPGGSYFRFPDGYAKKIPKGARLRFQMHYTPNGTAAEDLSRFGIVLAKGSNFKEIQTFALGKPDISIPAGDADHMEFASQVVPADVTLTALMPHMHVRGKSFSFFLQRPNGEKEPLLSVPRWDFNWQYQYELAEPLVVPKGSKLIVEAHWDNSANNANNIFPLVDAHFGEQTFDEMFIGYINAIPAKTVADTGHPGHAGRAHRRG
jgi:peroxiredoxin